MIGSLCDRAQQREIHCNYSLGLYYCCCTDSRHPGDPRWTGGTAICGDFINRQCFNGELGLQSKATLWSTTTCSYYLKLEHAKSSCHSPDRQHTTTCHVMLAYQHELQIYGRWIHAFGRQLLARDRSGLPCPQTMMKKRT
jgi:hypothetical protein